MALLFCTVKTFMSFRERHWLPMTSGTTKQTANLLTSGHKEAMNNFFLHEGRLFYQDFRTGGRIAMKLAPGNSSITITVIIRPFKLTCLAKVCTSDNQMAYFTAMT